MDALLLAEATSDVILAQPALTSLRDLKGKRVGLETTALGAYVLPRALQTVGGFSGGLRARAGVQ